MNRVVAQRSGVPTLRTEVVPAGVVDGRRARMYCVWVTAREALALERKAASLGWSVPDLIADFCRAHGV